MAEELGDKTEAPTPKRRQQARDQGQIPRSNDLTAAVLLLGFLILLNTFGKGLVSAMRTVLVKVLSPESLGNHSPAQMDRAIWSALSPVAAAMAPLFAGVIVIAILVNLLQVGFYFNFKRIQPNLAALNPLRGLGQIFKRQGFMMLVMSLLKMGLIGVVAYSAINGRIGQIVTTQKLTFLQAFGMGAEIVYAIAMRVAVLLLILAILDYAYQRFKHERELKMTKEEVKEEMRSMDGDPKIKSRRRAVAMQMAQQRMRKAVPTADVVVTNPTHFAVALKYDGGAMHAPKVVAKGQDYMALKIREIAASAGVPIVERKPLARALYQTCEVGQEIPEEFYAAVAEILAYVYELTGKVRRQMQTA